VIESLPDGSTIASVAVPVGSNGLLPSDVDPSMKLTVPVGIAGPLELTTDVSVTGSPVRTADGETVSEVVVVSPRVPATATA